MDEPTDEQNDESIKEFLEKASVELAGNDDLRARIGVLLDMKGCIDPLLEKLTADYNKQVAKDGQQPDDPNDQKTDDPNDQKTDVLLHTGSHHELISRLESMVLSLERRFNLQSCHCERCQR